MEPVSGSTKPAPPGRSAPRPPRAAPASPAERAPAPASSEATWWGAPVPALPTPPDAASSLAQALVGDAVLRHTAGRRVLDVGHGAPEIARWVESVAATLSIVPLAELDDAGELGIPAPDASFDTVYSLRTLPYVGHDEESSLAGVRSLLREMVRVTAPGGVLLVEINNPTSLRGVYHGIRRPITVVSTGSVVLAEDRRVTRYDTLGRLLTLAPKELELMAVYGIRVLVPISRVLAIPLLGRILAAGEWWARDSFLRHFGAHLLAVLRKPDPHAGRIARG